MERAVGTGGYFGAAVAVGGRRGAVLRESVARGGGRLALQGLQRVRRRHRAGARRRRRRPHRLR